MKDIIRMNQLAGLITEGQAKKMMKVLNENNTNLLEKYVNILSKQVIQPNMFKNNFRIWEPALFYDYDEAVKNKMIETNKISKEEFNKLHNELNSESNYPFNYFVRNWTVMDDEETRHEEDKNQDLNYFKTTYNVDDKTASIMKKIVDTFLD